MRLQLHFANCQTRWTSNYTNTSYFIAKKQEKAESPVRTRNKQQSARALDPLFLIKGYQEIELSQSKYTSLTGPGLELSDSLRLYFIHKVKRWRERNNIDSSDGAKTVETWSLPGKIMMEQRQVDSLVGAMHGGTDHNHQQAIPSWMWLLDTMYASNKNKGNHYSYYWDRQLPIINLLVLSDHEIHSSSSLSIHKKQDRQRKHLQNKWYNRLLLQQRLELLVLTGPSLEADSRPFQLQWIKEIEDWYRELLVMPSCDEGDDNVKTTKFQMTRIRVVPAKELQWNEASRMELQGRLRPAMPLTVDDDAGFCTLAWISNLTDYASGNILHGTTKEPLHVLQGCLCDLAVALEWFTQANATESSVLIPSVLWKQEMSSESSLNSYPFVRTVAVGKQGRRVVVGETTIRQASNAQTKSITAAKNQPTVSGGPTPRDIQLEALSCDFKFLPFYYK